MCFVVEWHVLIFEYSHFIFNKEIDSFRDILQTVVGFEC